VTLEVEAESEGHAKRLAENQAESDGFDGFEAFPEKPECAAVWIKDLESGKEKPLLDGINLLT